MCNKRISGLCALLFCLVLPLTVIHGQAPAAEYRITAGGVVGGGGTSTNDSYHVTGNVCANASGNWSNSFYAVNGGIISPSLSTLTTSYAGQTIDTVEIAGRTITVTYDNEYGQVSGVLYYRQRGAHGYTTAAMSAGTGKTMQYAIPANQFTARGLEYYMEITDTEMGTTNRLRTEADPYVFVTQMTNATGRRPVAMPDAQYRIVGVPIEITGSRTALTVFGDDLGDTNSRYWRMARYDDGETDDLQFYPDLDQVYPERGYWLIARSDRRYGAAGYSMQPNFAYDDVSYYRTEELNAGWNMLANPLPFAVGWSAIRVEDNGTVQAGHPLTAINDFPYYYNGTGYVEVAAIPAWEGIYLYVNKAGIKLLFPYEEYVDVVKSEEATSESFSIDNWHLDIIMMSGEYVDRLNSLGVKPEAESGRDMYDYAEPPPAPGAPHLAFVLPDEDGLFRTDYRARLNGGAIWDVVFSSAPGRILRVENLDALPGDLQAWLIMSNGSKVLLESDSPVTLPDGVTSARIVVGDKTYLEGDHGASVPTDFTLYQNYPNPFNPTTIIRFALPNPSHVSLDIYNILGRKVATLIDQPLQAGYHTVTWDGRTDGGKSAASGVYFYRVTGSQHVEQKKMILLK